LKIAIISRDNEFLYPTTYFGVSQGHIDHKLSKSAVVSSQVDYWSKLETHVTAEHIDASHNKIKLSNGKTFTYKALLLATGFDHQISAIKGLDKFSEAPEEENVFIHSLDHLKRISQNYYHGWRHKFGDFICYSPKFPYKGEGTDFYALYYENFLRHDKLINLSSQGARIQFWTPNKEIYRFAYANEVALDECHKRGIDVMFGWEMIEVKKTEIGEKIAVFRNVDNGEVIERPFQTACINPPSKPQSVITESGLGDKDGLVDVNRYTLQHKKYENVFAFGDCIGGDTTRTQHAAVAQNPIVKHNVLRFLQGKDCNAVYDGYTYFPLWTGNMSATSFAHKHDFEPDTWNHYIPNVGVLSRYYRFWQQWQFARQAPQYGSHEKDNGPPFGYFPAEYDELEHNEYLQTHQIPLEHVRHPDATRRLESHEEHPLAHFAHAHDGHHH